jgi:IS30 family transposase
MPLCYEHLNLMEREVIAISLRSGRSVRQIARLLGRSASTISRELRRNRSQGVYHSRRAQWMALDRRRLPRRKRLLDCPKRRNHMERLLRRYWSAEQIAGRLRFKGSAHAVSKSTIYRMIHAGRGRWRGYLRGPLKKSKRHERIRNRKMIDLRPAIVEQKIRAGDWEADTVRGPMASPVCVMTLVDRKSGYLVARLLKDRSADSLNQAAIEALQGFPVHTITVDNGMEFAKFPVLEAALGTQVYFAHEHCPGERGLNENTNGLLRQFFPKATDFSKVSPPQLRRAVSLLNSRPRKTRGFQTPEEVMAAAGVALVT